MTKVYLTSFDIKDLFERCKKLLQYIDSSDMKEKHKELAHSLLDLSHPRYAFTNFETTWKDILLNIDQVIPTKATSEEKEKYIQCIENIALGKTVTPSSYAVKHSDKDSLEQGSAVEIRCIEKDFETRYIIYKKGTDEIVDDAQGYGYKSFAAAKKAYWYKFSGGREKINESIRWWKKNKEFLQAVSHFIERKELDSFNDKKSEDYFRVFRYINKKVEKFKIEGFKEEYITKGLPDLI